MKAIEILKAVFPDGIETNDYAFLVELLARTQETPKPKGESASVAAPAEPNAPGSTLTQRMLDAMEFLRRNDGVTMASLAKELGINRQAVYNLCSQMRLRRGIDIRAEGGVLYLKEPRVNGAAPIQ